MNKKGSLLCLLALLLALALPGLAEPDLPYWGYLKLEHNMYARDDAYGLDGALMRHQVVEVIAREDNQRQVRIYNSAGEEKRAWFFAESIQPLGRTDWHQLCFVNNPDPADRLNLRAGPGRDRVSLGKYYNGVAPVMLSRPSNGWVRVRIDTRVGYMQDKFLQRSLEHPPPAPALPQVVIQSGKPRGENLRVGPDAKASNLGLYPDGTGALALGVVGNWVHLRLDENGHEGFMPADSLSPRLYFAEND